MLIGAPIHLVPTKARRRIVALFAGLLVAAALSVLPAACSGSGTTAVRPTTGILIRAETLTTGRGCGRGPTNLFRYAVVVFGYTSGPPEDLPSYGTPVTSNVFDCFTDGTFIQLPALAGNTSFRLEVYAYNEPAYIASRGTIDGAGTNTISLRTTAPTWTTECTALQQPDVQTLAQCRPLGSGLSGLGGTAPVTRIAVATASFRLPDGRVAQCQNGADAGAEAGTDASADAAAEAGTDAEAGIPADAGPAVTFVTARIRYRIGAAVGPTVDVRCPTTYTAEVPADPVRYDIDVGLIDPGGNPLGTTTCAVTSQPGATSSAVCP